MRGSSLCPAVRPLDESTVLQGIIFLQTFSMDEEKCRVKLWERADNQKGKNKANRGEVRYGGTDKGRLQGMKLFKRAERSAHRPGRGRRIAADVMTYSGCLRSARPRIPLKRIIFEVSACVIVCLSVGGGAGGGQNRQKDTDNRKRDRM